MVINEVNETRTECNDRHCYAKMLNTGEAQTRYYPLRTISL
jgi:hypothetical protein